MDKQLRQWLTSAPFRYNCCWPVMILHSDSWWLAMVGTGEYRNMTVCQNPVPLLAPGVTIVFPMIFWGPLKFMVNCLTHITAEWLRVVGTKAMDNRRPRSAPNFFPTAAWPMPTVLRKISGTPKMITEPFGSPFGTCAKCRCPWQYP